MKQIALCVMLLSIVGVSCSSLPAGNTLIPTQTPRIIVVTATPDPAQAVVSGRRTNTPTTPMISATPVIPIPSPVPAAPTTAATRAQTPTVPVPLGQSCSGKPQDAGKIALHIFNHNGGNNWIDLRIDEGEKIEIAPKANDQPGFRCVDVSPGYHRWSATMFRGGTVHGELKAVLGKSLAPIHFCWDWDNHKLTDRCTGIPAFHPTPTPTGCCAMLYPDSCGGLLASRR